MSQLPVASLRRLGWVAWLALGGVCVAIALGNVFESGFLEALLGPLSHHISADQALYSPLAYFCLFTLVYLLELRYPVQRRPFLASAFWQDSLWYVAGMGFQAAFLGAYAALLAGLYQSYLSFLTFSLAEQWHPVMRFLTAVLIVDFMRWFSHLVRHKVPLFWAFHAVHHAQGELNLFTDARVHPVDKMVSATIRIIPLLMLEVPAPVIIAWAVFETIYPKFYHANLRLNLGPLRFLLVTPQSHRVHHAHGSQYRDRNFGFTFSIWDRIFGTHYRDDFAYPETGIEDPGFPHERGRAPAVLLRIFCAQLLYPFLALYRQRRG